MPSTVQRNVGKRIFRDYPIVDFLEEVWRLDLYDLPEDRKLSLPRPVRRLLLRFKPETLRREEIESGLPPSRLAVAAAQAALEGTEAGTYGLVQHAAGKWEDVTGFEDDQMKWQKVLCILQIKKSEPRVLDDTNAYSPTQARRKISNDENDFATRLMFLFNSNLRSWVTGILVQGTTVSFWYADRMGVIVSSRFDCIKQPNFLYLAGLAIGTSTRHGLGISSFVSFLAHVGTEREKVETDMDFRYSYMCLPCPILDSGEALGEDEAIFFGRSNWRRPDVAPSQVVGRGTVVIPVGAVCVEAAKRFGSRKNSVLKFAWAAVTAPVEDTTVRLIRRRLRETRPDMLAHVTEIKASVTVNMEQMELPRADMFVLEEQRILRVQLLERYAPLESVHSVEDFKTCFLDVVKAHHWVYETSGILHRDISGDNIMIRQIDGVQRGVLADWDLAKQPSPRTAYRPELRFGTRPFFSADFEAPWWRGEHSYRHDLEAFMYLLTWFCACFVPDLRQVDTDRLAAWYDNFLEGDGWCRRFLSEHFDAVMAHAHPDYRVLAEEWVRPLSKYFEPLIDTTYSQMNILHRLNRGERWGIWAQGTYSSDTVEVELERMAEARDEIVNYEGFMACLRD